MGPMPNTRPGCYFIRSVELAQFFRQQAKRTHTYGGFPEGTRGSVIQCAVCRKVLNSFEFYEDECPGRPSDA